MKIILRSIAIAASLIIVYALTTTTDVSRKRVTAILRGKYPGYEIVSLDMEYVDFFSTVREADDDDKATMATAVIRNDDEQRTLHFDRLIVIWTVTHNAPDYGPNGPDDEYFISYGTAHDGILTDIEETVRDPWIVPDENGQLYHEDGISYTYYTYKYIEGICRTQGGRVYELNKDTLEWELSEKTYSWLDYFSNYTRITKEEGEKIIEEHTKGLK